MRNRLLAAFLVAPILMIILMVVVKREKRRELPSSTITSDQYPRVVAEWRSRPFVPIVPGEDLSRLVAGMSIYPRIVLEPPVERRLREAIHDLIAAYKIGTLEAYRKFRTPVPATIDQKSLALMKDYITFVEHSSQKTLPDNPETIFSRYFEVLNGGQGIKEMWKGISTEETEIVVEEVRKMPTPLAFAAMAKTNAGASCVNPTFRFVRGLPEILSQSGSARIATVSFLIANAEPDPPYRVLCRFYWEAQSDHWLPTEFCFSFVNTKGLKRKPIF